MTSTLEIQKIAYREHGYKYSGYRVSGYVNGRRVRIRCKDKHHATMVLAVEQSKAINANRSLEYLPTRLTKAQLDDAESIIDKLGGRVTLTEVYDFWRSNHAAAGEQVTLGDAITRFLNFQESRVREATWNQDKQTLNKFASEVGADSPVIEITHATITRYLDGLRSRDGISPASAKYWNGVRIVLHAFFSWSTAKPQEFTSHNMVADIRPKAREYKEIKTLTADQCAALMEHVAGLEGGRYARYFALALFAGIRPDVRGGELSKLEDRDIDLANGVVKVRPEVSKVHAARQITIQPNLRKWLEKYADQSLDITEHAYRKIKGKFAPGHDICRHTFCSNHIHVSGSLAETALESGNSEKILRANYLNRTTKADSEKFWAIEPK